MATKEWIAALGQRRDTSKSTDSLLADKVSERERKRIEQQEEVEELKHKAEVAKLKEEASKAEIKTDNPSGFQVKGSIDMGNFNIMEERKRAEDMANEAIGRVEEEKKALETRVVETEKKYSEMRYEALKDLFTKTNEELTRKIEETRKGANNDSDIASLFTKLETITPVLEKMGYSKAPATPSSGPSEQVLIMLKKMDIDNARAEREFQWKMRIDDKEAARLAKKDEMEMSYKAQELKDKKEAALANRNMLGDGLETIGRAIGSAMKDATPGGEIEEQAPPPRPAPRQPAPKVKPILAGVGEAGQIACPSCQEPIVIGADTEVATCANCGFKTPVIRENEPEPTG